MTRFVLFTLGLTTALLGCAGKDTPAGDDTAADTDTDTDTDTDATFSIQGMAVTISPDQAPAPAGTCVTAVDGDQASATGEPVAVATGTVGADGSYSLSGIPLGELPPIIIIDDCGSDTPRVFPTGAPVDPRLLEGVADGGVVTGVRTASLGMDAFEAIALSLQAAGATVDPAVAGMLMGGIWDSDQNPIAGATIVCDGCTAFYADEDPSDGMFATGGTVNTATTGGALYVVPGAPRGEYGARADGYTFDTWPAGAPEGGAMFLPWLGQPQ